MTQQLIGDSSTRGKELNGRLWRETRDSFLIVAVFFGGVGGWAALAPLASAVVASGSVVVSGSRQTVQHRDGGIVSRILVTEDQRVEAGEILVELDNTELVAQHDVMTAQFITLSAQESRLNAESQHLDVVAEPEQFASLDVVDRIAADEALAAQRDRLEARRDSVESEIAVLERRIEQLRAQIGGSQAQVTSHERQKELLEEELEGVRSLNERGLTPTNRVRELERALASLEGGRAEYESNIARVSEEIGEAELEMLRARREFDDEVAAELLEVEQRLAQLEPVREAIGAQIERARVRAPATGRIVGLRVHTEAGVIAPGQVLMEIVPENRPLVVQAHVKPADIDSLHPGARAQIRLTAFSASQAPILLGSLSLVSADRMIEESTGEAYYLAEATIDADALQRIEAIREGTTQLRPGMPAEVVIPVRSRTALQYLVEPLTDRFWRAFRET